MIHNNYPLPLKSLPHTINLKKIRVDISSILKKNPPSSKNGAHIQLSIPL